jgi:hypothetical protein
MGRGSGGIGWRILKGGLSKGRFFCMDELREQREREACSEYVKGGAKPGGTAGLYKALLVLLVIWPFSFIGGPLGFVVAFILLIMAVVVLINGIMTLLTKKDCQNAADVGYGIASVVTPAIVMVSVGLALLGSNRAVYNLFASNGLDFWYTEPLGDSLVDYKTEHDDQLPKADKWCDELKAGDNYARYVFHQDHNDNWYCEFSMNEHAAELGVEAPNDMVLLFQSKRGWNQIGGLELLSEEVGSYIRVFLVDGSKKFVRGRDICHLRWELEDSGVTPLLAIGGVYTFGGLILGGLFLWIVKRWGRYTGGMVVPAIVAFVSLGIGLYLAIAAEELYSISYDRGLGALVGGAVGLLVGGGYVIILAAVREHKKDCPTMIGYATMLGAAAGVFCSALVHGALMVGYGESNFANLLFGGGFGCVAGVILGWIAGAILDRKNIKPEVTNG